jgi:hypothetical protein
MKNQVWELLMDLTTPANLYEENLTKTMAPEHSQCSRSQGGGAHGKSPEVDVYFRIIIMRVQRFLFVVFSPLVFLAAAHEFVKPQHVMQVSIIRSEFPMQLFVYTEELGSDLQQATAMMFKSLMDS